MSYVVVAQADGSSRVLSGVVLTARDEVVPSRAVHGVLGFRSTQAWFCSASSLGQDSSGRM